jgi:sulfur-oxidizing protein SoxX
MPKPGSARLPVRRLVEAALLAMLAAPAHAGTDRMDAPLTGMPGDAARGRAIVASRTGGLCLLCHAAPIAEERFQGDIGPDLAGIGARLSPGELRLRVADAGALNPDTVMPSYRRTEGVRVGRAWAGRPILTDQQIEDVVAWLAGQQAP